MLMANSVEGRFPFLDRDVIALADSLPEQYKLRVLDEKHVLKRAARGLVADSILARQKQPYRAPDALSFIGTDAPDYVNDMMSESSVRAAGVFEPALIAQLWRKCRSLPEHGQFSNADNMALVGVLSTQLLHHQLIQNRPTGGPPVALKTDEDRVRGLES
jgi:asparagine synthase (glutamine-hydrolysing)